MKTAGIIAEYNPFHNGHQYQIEETRRRTGADYVVVVMSGDFVQRGEPAMVGKYDRTRMALHGGADLVIQLPTCASLSSAEGFATGGVGILDGLSVIDVISFGCEASSSEEQKALDGIARILAEEPVAYRKYLEQYLKTGISYPEAREQALLSYIEEGGSQGHVCDGIGAEKLHRLISAPNNILAIEYRKAMFRSNSKMDVCMIPRQGSGYHETELQESYGSATAIRQYLMEHSAKEERDQAIVTNEFHKWKQYCPEETVSILEESQKKNGFQWADDYSDLLYQGLLQRRFSTEASSDLDHRMEKLLEHYKSWTSFAEEMKTRNQTMTAINRYLAGIMVGYSTREWQVAKVCQFAPYVRVLGYRKEAGALIKAMAEASALPIITRPVQAAEVLTPEAYQLFLRDLAASDLYRQVRYRKTGEEQRSDYRMPLVIL